MWDVSDRFLDGVATSHEVVTRVEVWRSGVRVLDDLPITGGTVTIDESSKVRRTLDIATSDIALDPKEAEDTLAPFGTELRVFSGIRFTEGDTEMVPVGVFAIQNAGRSGWLDEVGISAEDRSRSVADSRLLIPYTPSGVSVASAVTTLVSQVFSTVEVYDLTPAIKASRVTASKVTYERERWDAVESLMSGIGSEAFFDPEGRLILREVPSITGTDPSVWAVEANTPDSVMLDIGTSLSSDKVYNAVVATSSADSDTPITRIVYQRTGALKWQYGGFQRPRFYSSPLIKTTQDAIDAATSILARSLVYSQNVSLQAVPNPALDVGDLITVTRPDGSTEQRIVTRITLPLGLDAMAIETRVGVDVAVADTVGELS